MPAQPLFIIQVAASDRPESEGSALATTILAKTRPSHAPTFSELAPSSSLTLVKP
jgi:hypothetical protein